MRTLLSAPAGPPRPAARGRHHQPGPCEPQPPDQGQRLDSRPSADRLDLRPPRRRAGHRVRAATAAGCTSARTSPKCSRAKGFFVVGFDVKAYLEGFTSGQTTLRAEDEPGDYKVLADFAARGRERGSRS